MTGGALQHLEKWGWCLRMIEKISGGKRKNISNSTGVVEFEMFFVFLNILSIAFMFEIPHKKR